MSDEALETPDRKELQALEREGRPGAYLYANSDIVYIHKDGRKAHAVNTSPPRMNVYLPYEHEDIGGLINASVEQEEAKGEAEEVPAKKPAPKKSGFKQNYRQYNKLLKDSYFIVDESDPRTSFFYIPRLRTSRTIDRQIALRGLSPTTSKTILERPSALKYDPFQSLKMWQTEDGESIFNTYVPAVWRENLFYEGTPIPKANLPEVFERFFAYVTGNDSASKRYMLAWIANSLRQKNMQYLVMIGTKGVGKGILGQILEYLHGPENYVNRSITQVGSHFNGGIENKTILHFDEGQLNDRDQLAALKKLIDPKIEINKKFVNSYQTEQRASVFLTANEFDAIEYDTDDRRYSVVNLPETPLDENPHVWAGLAPDRATYVDMLVRDEENLAALAHYLYHLDIGDLHMTRAFRGSYYREIAIAQLQGWESATRDLILSVEGQDIPLKDVQAKLAEAKITKRLGRPISRRDLQALGKKTGEFRVFNTKANAWRIKK